MNQKHVAPFEEYLANATVSTGCHMLCFAMFMGISGEDATTEACNWARGFPKIVNSLGFVGRIHNDLTDYEVYPKYN